ncbi:MAG: hypothetical protein WCA08_07410 [Desulfoferrobacter sp.]
MKRAALFAFNGESMCFVHVLLNALDMHERGYEIKIVFEGAATKLIIDLSAGNSVGSDLYRKAKSLGLFEGTCKACSTKMGALDAAKTEGLRLLDEMKGHASMAEFIEQGFEVITL